mgnify:FL=1
MTAIAIAVIIASSGRKADSSESATSEVPARVMLNDTLTNAMSDSDTLSGMDRTIDKYLAQWGIHGASLAIMRNDSLVYAKGYGWADEEKGLKMGPGNILRMASVSKLITAAGIMLLQEKGKLSLDDTVFGQSGILNDSIYTKSIKYSKIYDITVEQLLRHQGGFSNSRGDPMFSTRDIIRQFGLEGAPDHETLVKCILKRPLGFKPGESQRYSNFGYLLLSMIIEKVSGCDYESFIKDNILTPAGCYDMHLAGNYYEEKRANEVKYYMHAGSELVEEYNLSGRMVERCYGGNDIHALSGAGAWCGSPAELCRFVASIDGKSEVQDILTKESIRQMTEYFDPLTYSLGWNDTKPNGEWTRTGTLSGTSALIKYFPDGECWIMITNTSTWRGPGFTRYTEQLFRKCRERYGSLIPHRNLFAVSCGSQAVTKK